MWFHLGTKGPGWFPEILKKSSEGFPFNMFYVLTGNYPVCTTDSWGDSPMGPLNQKALKPLSSKFQGSSRTLLIKP
jgi:hypothetical protein